MLLAETVESVKAHGTTINNKIAFIFAYTASSNRSSAMLNEEWMNHKENPIDEIRNITNCLYQ